MEKEDLKKQIDELIKQGELLALSLLKSNSEGLRTLEEHKINKDALPDFNSNYQNWYTVACNLVKLVIPFRLSDFTNLYYTKKTKNITFDNYCIYDALCGNTFTQYGRTIAEPITAYKKVMIQVGIVKSVKTLLDDYFYNMEYELQVDILNEELNSANELLKKKFYRSAGTISGVVLEKHLKQVCLNHNLKIIKKEPTISDYNEQLRNEGIINKILWRRIQTLGDIRNVCAHNKEMEPSEQDVKDIIDGTKYIISSLN